MRGSPRRQQIAFGFDLLDKNGDFFAEIVEDTLLFYLFLEVGEGGYFFFEGLESLDVDFVQVVEPVGFVSFVCALSPEHIELVADVVDTLTFAIGDGVALDVLYVEPEFVFQIQNKMIIENDFLFPVPAAEQVDESLTKVNAGKALSRGWNVALQIELSPLKKQEIEHPHVIVQFFREASAN